MSVEANYPGMTKTVPVVLLGESGHSKDGQLKAGILRFRGGTTGIFVLRGSSQNLIVLDEAVYNANLFGFSAPSIRMPSRDLKIYKGGFPVQRRYLSSPLLTSNSKATTNSLLVRGHRAHCPPPHPGRVIQRSRPLSFRKRTYVIFYPRRQPVQGR